MTDGEAPRELVITIRRDPASGAYTYTHTLDGHLVGTGKAHTLTEAAQETAWQAGLVDRLAKAL